MSPEADDVERLVAYDERLRQGMVGDSTHRETADQTPASLSADLVECLHLIEGVWPRSGPQSVAARLPAQVGRFEIERLLGQGGFGIVYLARDPLLHRRVALKVPRLHSLASDRLRQRFQLEARAAAALDHPHIVPIYETGSEGPLLYIAFAYCEGPSLAEWLKHQEQPAQASTAARIVMQLATAMQYSHSRGIVHRDLKPSNVLLFPAPAQAAPSDGSLEFTPRIVDFGLARLAEEELEATGTSGVIGTPLYMAPEQALGQPERVGPPADVYALGAILYELLCRRPPFVGAAPLEVLDQVRHAEPPGVRTARPDVARDLETICLKCLQKRPEDRYATAQDLAHDLERFLSGEPITARPMTALARLYRWCQQPQRLREAGLTVIGVSIVTGGWTVYTAMMMAWGVVQRPNNMTPFEVCLHTLPLIVFVTPLMITAGFKMMAAQRWAIQLATGGGLALTVVAILLSLGLIDNPYTGLWNDLPGFSMVIYSMMGMLFLLQTVAGVVAWIALQGCPRRC